MPESVPSHTVIGMTSSAAHETSRIDTSLQPEEAAGEDVSSSEFAALRARQGAPSVVLYVDLDGVLQHHAVLHHPRRGIHMCPREAPGRELFEWAHYLVEVLEEFPDVRCVLSSSWCVWPGYGRTLQRLPAILRSRFIGGTYHSRVFGSDVWAVSSFRSKPRWLQILEDVRRRRPRHWLVLDDDIEGWPATAARHLIPCDGNVGLSSSETRSLLVEQLRSLHSNHGEGS